MAPETLEHLEWHLARSPRGSSCVRVCAQGRTGAGSPSPRKRHTREHTESLGKTKQPMSAEAPCAVTVADTPTLDSFANHDVLPFEHLTFDFSSRMEAPATLELAGLRDQELSLSRLSIQRMHSRSSLVNLRAPPRDVVAAELVELLAGRKRHASCAVVDATIELHGTCHSPSRLRCVVCASSQALA